MAPMALVAYLTLFVAVGFLFVFSALMLGKLLRPAAPTPKKLETYECGEPAIGDAGIQFDLRFYVVALLFLLFEVEAAFLFPPAIIFGKYFHKNASSEKVLNHHPKFSAEAGGRTIETPALDGQQTTGLTPYCRRLLTTATMVDLSIFFGLLLAGFGYVWRCGDLDWVRALRYPLTPAEAAAMRAIVRRGGYA